MDRLARIFVAPANAPDPVPPPSSPEVAVLAPPPAALAVGSAVALGLGGAAVVAVWGAPAFGAAAPAGPRARRSATRLSERGHAASAAGRLVRVALEHPAEADRIAIPLVLVIAGPRDAEVDRVLAARDHVVVAGGGVLADIAAHSVAALGPRTTTLALPDAPLARALATTGAALTAPWRAPTLAALARRPERSA